MERQVAANESSIEMRLARRIKAVRAYKGITQKELAEACGISNQTLSNIEYGKTDFRIGTLKIIEEVLQTTLLTIPNEEIYL